MKSKSSLVPSRFVLPYCSVSSGTRQVWVIGSLPKLRHTPLLECHLLTYCLQLSAYYRHLEELVRQMYPLDEAFMLSVLAPNTMYPHVSPTAMLELSDANRRPTRRAHANGHAGGAGTSTRGAGVIESPLKRKRPVTRDDTDESTPRRGPAALDAEAYRPGGGNRPRATARKP